MANTVMLVEDDADLREELAFFIESRGPRVVNAEHGLDALEKLEQIAPPCLIIVDLMMPVMDGWRLRAELLARPALASIAVVLLSGIADLEAEAKSLDVVGYLRKPLDLAALCRVIDEHC